jgi:hypothetical protein
MVKNDYPQEVKNAISAELHGWEAELAAGERATAGAGAHRARPSLSSSSAAAAAAGRREARDHWQLDSRLDALLQVARLGGLAPSPARAWRRARFTLSSD